MKNLTIEQVEILIANGTLMFHERSYGYQLIFKDKFKYAEDLPYGYPSLISVRDYENKNIAIPSELFLKVKSGTTQEFYIVPKGLLELKNLKEKDFLILTLLAKWKTASEQYFLNNTENNDNKDATNLLLEEQCLTTYREIYSLATKNMLVGKSFSDKELLNGYICGRFYKNNLLQYSKELYKIVLPKENSEIELLSLVENKNDVEVFENTALNISDENHLYNICNKYLTIYVDLYDLWYSLLEKIPESSKNSNSPFLKYFVNRLKTYKFSSNDMIEYLKEIEKFDVSVAKEEFLYQFNKCDKKAVVSYCETYLKKHDCLPKVETNLVLGEDSEIIYTNQVNFNYQLIRQVVSNNPMASQTLMMIVYHCFINEEKDLCKLEYTLSEEISTAEFIISTLDKETSLILKEKCKKYVEAVISEQFLTKEMLKKICKNGVHRTTYENKEDVMKAYKKVKDVLILKNALDKDLQQKTDVHTRIKKI